MEKKQMEEKEMEVAAISKNPKNFRKRSTSHRESKDAEEGEVGLCEPSGASKRYRPLLPSCAMSIPSLLNSEGLHQQSRKPIPSQMRIASIHRPADVIASDKSDKRTKPADLSTSSHTAGLPHEVTKPLPRATSSSSATWTKYPVPPPSAVVPSKRVGLPYEATKLLPGATSSSSATWMKYPVRAQSPPSAFVPFHPASPSEVTTTTTAFGFLQKPGLHGPTTPSTPILNPNRCHGEIINLSDDSDDCEEQWNKKSTTTSTSTSRKNDQVSVAGTAHSIVEVKNEPLTDFMMMNTIFLVTVHDSPLGPVPVPFTECHNFHILFATLIEERGVSDDDARKINNITTTFAWTGGEFGGKIGGIRRHKPRDWDYFCDTLRKAHEMDFDRFMGKCEVVMKLHINAV